MLLEGKTTIIYGGGGAIGAAAARAFCREGATVHLAGRTLDEDAVDRHAADVAATGAQARRAARRHERRGLHGAGRHRRPHPLHQGPGRRTQVAFDAFETMRRQLSVELGPHGIRFVTLASGGVPESLPPDMDGRDAVTEMIEASTLLGRAATLDDVGNAAAFAASDRARTMTGAIVNVSCGALID